MEDDTKTIRRSELYDQVWSVAITQLSKQYGLSDVGLAKICRRYNIPRPPRGYWARKTAGQKVKQIPLPQGEDAIIYIQSTPRGRYAARQAKPATQVPEEDRIIVPERLSNPHPLVKQSSEILLGSQADSTGIVNPPKGCLNITVSKNSLRRALRIMDTVLKALEERGHSVKLADRETQTKIQGIPIRFGITEQVITRKKRPEEHDLSGPYRFRHNLFVDERVPSGKLSLSITSTAGLWDFGLQSNWRDAKKTKLENRINSFIEGLETVAAATIEREREKEEERLREIELEKKREEERARRAELRREYLKEEARVNALLQASEDWKRSEILREYVAEIKRRMAEDALPEGFETPSDEWLQWARDQADRLDPLSPSPPSILDEECPPEEDNRPYWKRW